MDSVQARDTRIWFGLQHQGSCRVRVEIVDTAQKVIKSLVDRMMTSGYYNMYWGKKDDSGRWVPRGLYFYKVISSCLPEKKGKLWASYRPFERVVQLLVDTTDLEAAVTVRVDTTLARIALEVYTQYGVLIDSLCPDTVLASGTHRFVWKPQIGTALGEYWVRMNVESFLTEERVRLR
jgi:flagellar hook assembly protein FlgD